MTAIFRVDGISKIYGNTKVLKNVTLKLETGKIHALVGHNGAGKSTLLKVLSGVEKPDEGTLNLDNHNVVFHTPRDAQHNGVTCVYQELRLVNELTVAENMFLGQEITRGGLVNRREMNRITADLLEQYGLDISPVAKVSTLSHPQKQLVEIVAGLRKNAKFLFLDEPTTSLEFTQIQEFLTNIRNIVDTKDVGIVLVTHKLDEVYAVSDQITVLCDGEVMMDGPLNSVSRDEVVKFIIGREADAEDQVSKVTLTAAKKRANAEQPVLSVKHMRTNHVRDISLNVFPGRILGIYGLGGSGRTEFLRALYGLDPIVSGEVLLHRKPYHPTSPSAAMRAGVAYVTEERKVDGFIPGMNSIMNAALPTLKQFSRFGVVSKRKLQKKVMDVLKPLQIRGNTLEAMSGLSGGNQQKVLFARVILQQGNLLLFDEPTKGIDIGAKSEIYSLIRTLAEEQSVAVVVVSSEEDEVLALSDDIVIFRAGQCDGHVYSREEMTAARLRSIALEDGVNV